VLELMREMIFSVAQNAVCGTKNVPRPLVLFAASQHRVRIGHKRVGTAAKREQHHP
jgi:hypothetical protein